MVNWNEKVFNKRIIITKNIGLSANIKIKEILSGRFMCSLDVIIKERLNHLCIRNEFDFLKLLRCSYNVLKEIFMTSFYLNEKFKLMCNKSELIDFIKNLLDKDYEIMELTQIISDYVQYRNHINDQIIKEFVKKIYRYQLSIDKFIDEFFFNRDLFYRSFSEECNFAIKYYQSSPKEINKLYIYLFMKNETSEYTISTMLNKIIMEIVFNRCDLVSIKTMNNPQFVEKNKFRVLKLNKKYVTKKFELN